MNSKKSFLALHLLLISSVSGFSCRLELAVTYDNRTRPLLPFVRAAIHNWPLDSSIKIDQLIELQVDSQVETAHQLRSKLFDQENQLRPFVVVDLTEKAAKLDPEVVRLNIRSWVRSWQIPTLAIGRQPTRLDRLPTEWQQLDPVERQLLVQLHPPVDTLSHLVADLAGHFRPQQVVLLYERAFHLDQRAPHLFKRYRLRYNHRQIDGQQVMHMRRVLQEVGRTKSGHFYVLGSIDTLNSVLALAHELELLTIGREWYLISRQGGDLQCETCRTGSVVFAQPMRVQRLFYDHEPTLPPLVGVSRLSSLFVYDSTRFLLHTLQELVVKAVKNSKLPAMDPKSRLRWTSVAQSDSAPVRRSNASLEENMVDPSGGMVNQRSWCHLRHEMSQEGFFGLYGRLVVDQSIDHLGYQELNLRLVRFELWRRKPPPEPPLALSENGQPTTEIPETALQQVTPTPLPQPFVPLKMAEWIFQWPRGLIVWTAALEQSRPKKHYRIVTIVQPPFVIKRGNLTNPSWDGYCIDLLTEMQLEMNYTWSYEIYEVPDGSYGTKDRKTQKWDGMIGQLADSKADIAVGPVSVMAERESVVDFTVPYYDLVGVSILMKKSASRSHLFKFLTVLDNQVWLCILGAYLVTSVCLWTLDKLSPFSFSNNRILYSHCIEKRDFTFKECFWFGMTSITPQGGGEAPKNYSGKMAVATWWAFGFIIIACYTANLAAFLTVSRLDSPIESLQHLLEQYRIRYAPQVGTQALTYFERMAYIERKFYEIWKQMSIQGIGVKDERERARLAVWNYPISDRYTKILHQMHLTGLPLTFEEGVQRVKASKSAQEGFAFLADATKIRYTVMINCDVRQVGNEFSRKPLALAVPENSTLKDELSSAILKLLNLRKLEALKEKWWNENRERKQDCDSDRKSNDGISINNIGGVFVVIFVGVALASITLLAEWLWKKYRKPAVKTTAVVHIKEHRPRHPHLSSHHAIHSFAHFQSDSGTSGGFNTPYTHATVSSQLHLPAYSSALSGVYERPGPMLPISS